MSEIEKAQPSGPTAEEMAKNFRRNWLNQDEHAWGDAEVAAFARDYAARQSERVRELETLLVCVFCGELVKKGATILCSKHANERFDNWETHRIKIQARAESAERRLQEMAKALHDQEHWIMALRLLLSEAYNTFPPDTPFSGLAADIAKALSGLASEQAKAKATVPDTPSAGQPE
jgi:hypothetical protein